MAGGGQWPVANTIRKRSPAPFPDSIALAGSLTSGKALLQV